MNREGDKRPLVAAALQHKAKLETPKNALEEIGDQGLPCTNGPLFYETTRAVGEDTWKWWKSIVEMEADQHVPGATPIRQEKGLEHTWSAKTFSSYWVQTFSMAHAKIQAESIAQLIGT